MSPEEALECAAFVKAGWQPFELIFYTEQELVQSFDGYSYLDVMGALHDLVKFCDAAPPLWLIRDFAHNHQTGSFLYVDGRNPFE
ncbi:hypothetical protein GTQ99_00565 [Kineococcus sp. T13]|uniref:hypothetical protein n=1 Tax=Kineococcus vitellinus TaxID=2696565 RepID=UPI001412F48A|nr:hypothetical protein [Kineococcus vitellinus]NAZ73924.1 hypothetical protein [Kineococcus vitellinus]